MTKNENHYAVVVGIDWYPGVGDLRLPRKDAGSFVEWLLDDDGGRVPKDNVRPVIVEGEKHDFEDALSAKPTSMELETEIVRLNGEFRDKLKTDATAWDSSRLYIYASGHGIATDYGVGSLLFADADPARDFWDSLEFTEYESWYIRAGLFREVFVFADCCRERRPQAPSLKPRLGRPRQNYGTGTEVLVGYGADYGERAYEPEPNELDDLRGHFTQALIDGLKGGAADLETGAISADALNDYVTDAVKEATRGSRFPQAPDIRGSLGMLIRPEGIGTLPRVKRSVTINFPEGYTGEVELLCEGARVEIWDTGKGPWTHEVDDNVFYSVRPLDGQPPFKDGGAFRVLTRTADVHLDV